MERLRAYGAKCLPITAYGSQNNFVEVTGVKLVSILRGTGRERRDEFVEALRQLVFEARVVVFRDQDIVQGADQVDISAWFNPLESTFYKHKMSPHPHVFRVSNDPISGCTGVGRTGWHVDGSFQPSPFSHAVYHIISCPSRGATAFLPLEEFHQGLEPGFRERLENLSMLSDRRSKLAKPVVYAHPKTGRTTMCFHLGMIEGFQTSEGVTTGRDETRNILLELEREILSSGLIYYHEWRPGDFIITDNVAVAHEATPETQLPAKVVGLRIMHRTTTVGWREDGRT